MKIAVVGTGYVGLVSGTCFASIGHEVVCIDNNKDKIDNLNNRGVIPIYEPGLEDLVKQNVAEGRLEFTTDLKAAVAASDVVFIAVGTPPRPDNGQADLKYVYQVAEEIGEAIDGFTVVVDKSTVPIGTAEEVTAIIEKVNPEADFAVVSNPEFLREGFAIDDFLNGDRVVVGVENSQAEELMKEVYIPLEKRGVQVLMTRVKTAEMIKYASNTFLATKLGFINEIADLCEKVGADVDQVAHAMGMDTRIGAKFLQAGPGFGGSCFPKDTMALEYIAKENGCDLSIVKATIDSNVNRKLRMAEKVAEALDGSLEGKTIGVLGLAFKGNTDDTRESPAIAIIKEMQKMGASIKAYDPAAIEEAKHELTDVKYGSDEYSVCDNADALVILTEWTQFAVLDLELVKAKLNNPILVDLRNLYSVAEVTTKGLKYYSIGR
ncbi:MAG TPA: UDP-glucose 6-dehydrogenase [Alphaproteobacteria bacterium]|nr:UDP-glucose 6-dehydrogenase [Alphaproteobacteria bacterium]